MAYNPSPVAYGAATAKHIYIYTHEVYMTCIELYKKNIAIYRSYIRLYANMTGILFDIDRHRKGHI